MDASHPKLLQAEAPAGTNLRVVPDRQASHHRPERTGRGAWDNAARLGLPGLVSTDLASRLVEPRGHTPLPVLVKWGFRIMPFKLGAMAAAERPPPRAHGRESPDKVLTPNSSLLPLPPDTPSALPCHPSGGVTPPPLGNGE